MIQNFHFHALIPKTEQKMHLHKKEEDTDEP